MLRTNQIAANSVKKIAGLLMLTLLLQGCGSSRMSDLELFVDNAYKDKKPDIEPLPAIRPFIGYAYSGSPEEDPFAPSNIKLGGEAGTAESGQRPDSNRRREPLEEFPLDALRMVGTMSKNDQPWVIVKTSVGTALLATIGNYMGENDGKIKQILTEEQKVVLSETVLDPSGRWITREVEITVDEQ